MIYIFFLVGIKEKITAQQNEPWTNHQHDTAIKLLYHVLNVEIWNLLGIILIQ